MTRPSWPRVVAVSSIITVAFMGSVLVTPLYPLYQRRLGFSDVRLTLVYAAYVLGNAVALLVLGPLLDQVGRRRTALPALGLAAVSAGVFAVADHTAWLFVARVLVGLAVGVASGTGTAWLAELLGPDRRSLASVVGAVANLAGIAVGPLLGGLLAERAPYPLELPFAAYVLLVAVVVVAVARTPEPVAREPVRLADLRLRASVGVPRALVGRFVPPAIAGFVTFALGGLYFAVVPGLIRRDLGISDVSVSGVVVFVLGVVAIAVVLLTRGATPDQAMTAGLVGVLPAGALVVLAQAARSLTVLLLAAAVAGTALALGYRGSLQVVNEIAPDDRRAALTSSYFLAVFAGNSLPVIGIGVLATLVSPFTATVAFAVAVALLALVALLWRRRTSSAAIR